jgi:hypothetical protein
MLRRFNASLIRETTGAKVKIRSQRIGRCCRGGVRRPRHGVVAVAPARRVEAHDEITVERERLSLLVSSVNPSVSRSRRRFLTLLPPSSTRLIKLK